MNEYCQKIDAFLAKHYMSISLGSVIAILCVLTYVWFVFFSYDNIDSNSTMGKIREQQLQSTGIAKKIRQDIERSLDYNQTARRLIESTERGVGQSQQLNYRAKEYNRQAGSRINENQRAVDSARVLLEENERIFKSIQKRNKEKGKTLEKTTESNGGSSNSR